MGSSKQPKAPKAPGMTPPPNVNSPFASADYNHGTYNLSSPFEQANSGNVQAAQQGFSNALQTVNNPQQDINQAEQVYSNLETPAYQRAIGQYLGNQQASLGSQYQGTYGQLTMNQANQQAALAQAQLQSNIYNAGQAKYQQDIQNAQGLGTLNNQAMTTELQPYQTLQPFLSTAGQNVSEYNNALNNQFATQAQMYNEQLALQQQQAQSQAGMLGSIGSTVGGALGNLALPGIGGIAGSALGGAAGSAAGGGSALSGGANALGFGGGSGGFNPGTI